ncbi:hypothetical protein CR157_02635 [Halomonas sp. LBP4]|nr:hypothetical protein CR157_02635 [Halomonas sp. LBP4]
MIEGGDSLGTGAVELVRRDDYRVVGESFRKKFYFSGGELNQVTLSLDRQRDFHATLLVFESLVEALRARYGQEVNYSVEPLGVMKEAEADWFNSNGVNISLYAMTIGDSDALLNVNYQVRVSEEAGKL